MTIAIITDSFSEARDAIDRLATSLIEDPDLAVELLEMLATHASYRASDAHCLFVEYMREKASTSTRPKGE